MLRLNATPIAIQPGGVLVRTIIFAFAVALAACSTPDAQVADDLRLVILGTGTPIADPERSGPSLAVVAGDKAYLFDAGPGVVRRAAAARLADDVDALQVNTLDIVFLTHLHSDHTLGLPDLIFSPWVLARSAPLRVYGPPGTAAMAAHLEAAYEEDIRQRLDGLEPANETGYRTEVSEIEQGGLVYEDDHVRIEAIPVLHGSWSHAFGYRITDGERVIVISGDTHPSPALIEASRGADVLVHEVYSTEGHAALPPAWRRYHASFHTSTEELVAIANEAQPGLLVLYHQLYFGVDDADLITEIRSRGYAGPVVSAADLDVY